MYMQIFSITQLKFSIRYEFKLDLNSYDYIDTYSLYIDMSLEINHCVALQHNLTSFDTYIGVYL